MKILNIILCIMFLLFLGVQYNDPDPYLWMPIYGFVAYVCGLAAMGKYHKIVIFLQNLVEFLKTQNAESNQNSN